VKPGIVLKSGKITPDNTRFLMHARQNKAAAETLSRAKNILRGVEK